MGEERIKDEVDSRSWKARPAVFVTIVLLLAAIPCGIAVFPRLYFGYGVEDTLQFYECRGGKTKTSKDHREREFSMIEIGMTEEEVESLLGPPFFRAGDPPLLLFAEPVNKTCGHARAIGLDEDGRVEKITRTFIGKGEYPYPWQAMPAF